VTQEVESACLVSWGAELKLQYCHGEKQNNNALLKGFGASAHLLGNRGS
jgi:hypothetical protein